MQWKLMCKVCQKLLDDEAEVMRHFFTAHREIAIYATPVAVGELPIPAKKAQASTPKPVFRKPLKEETEEEPEAEMETEEDLNLE